MKAHSGKRARFIGQWCLGILLTLASGSCAGGPTLTIPAFTPTSAMIILPPLIPTATRTAAAEPSATPEPTAASPGSATPITDGTVPVVPGPVIDQNNVDLLVLLADLPIEGGGLAWSPDGQTLAVGMSASVALLSPLSGGEIRSFKAPEGTELSSRRWFGSVAFSPQGNEIAGGFDGSVAVWDVRTGKMVREYQGHYWTTSLAYSPDGRWLAIADTSGGMVQDLKSRSVTFVGSGGAAWELAISPDSKHLVSFSEYGAQLWDLGSRTLQYDDVPDAAHQMAFSPDSTLVTGGNSLVDVRTNEVVRQLPSSSDTSICAAFHPGGAVLVRGLGDGSIEVIDVGSGDAIRRFAGHGTDILEMAFSPDGRLLASVGDDGKVRLWGVPSGTDSVPAPTSTPRQTPRITATAGSALAVSPGADIEQENLSQLVRLAEIPLMAGGVAWSPDGQTLAVGLRDAIALLSPLSGSPTRTLEAREGTENNEWRFGAAAFSPDGVEIAGGFDGMLGVWDTRTGKLLKDYRGVWVTSVAYSADGRWLAFSEYLRGQVLDRRTGGSVFKFMAGPPGMVVTAVAFSPDSRYLAGFGFESDRPGDESVTAGGSIWETGSWRLARELITPGGVILTFSPDGRMIADEQMLVDVDSGEWVRGMECGDFQACTSVAFHPDGEILAVGLEAGTIRFIDPWSGKVLGELAGHADRISGLAFSPDGRLLASVGEDKMVRLWGVPAGQ